MFNGVIPHSRLERCVSGLRDYPIPSEVRVYSANTGELLRIEEPTKFTTENKSERKGSKRKHD